MYGFLVKSSFSLEKQSKFSKKKSQNFFIVRKLKMMKFIYDSLDTVKKLKHPTKKDFINLTIAILVLVIIA